MTWDQSKAYDPLGFGFPTLGYKAGLWIEAYCCHGPGDVQGEPVVLDEEMWRFLGETYRIHPETGRRVYAEAVLSRPKGRAKSEMAGFIGCFEAFGDEARFDRWDEDGQPVGRPVRTPILKCLATEESQAGNTFENIAFIAAEWGPVHHPDIYGDVSGVRNYQAATTIYLPNGGTIQACTAGDSSKDGGKETWVCADETHLYVLKALKSMYGTVSRNLGKRKLAQPWLLQTSTAYRPGENSVFEDTLTAWRKKQLPADVYVDHREAKGRIDIADRDHTLAQLRYVYGPAADWMDLPAIYGKMTDVRVCPDEETAARYYLNRPMSSKDAWIAKDVVERQASEERIQAGESVALGFDGSLNDDSTVLIASRMSDGLIQPIGIWEKPKGPAGNFWEVPRLEVVAAIDHAFEQFDVVRMYADPHEWRSEVDAIAERHGGERVFSWATSRDVAMGAALDRLRVDLITEHVKHSGDGRLMEHFGNAYVRRKGIHRLVRKEHEKSDRKIDSVVGATLAYEARADAITGGWGTEPDPVDTRMFVFR